MTPLLACLATTCLTATVAAALLGNHDAAMWLSLVTAALVAMLMQWWRAEW